jgi:hypothetical protein
MKKALILILFLNISNGWSQNATFFDGKKFQLEYFLANGVRQDLNLSGNDYPFPPSVEFSKDEDDVTSLFVSLAGYCNASSIKYKVENDFFEVIERGATTLRQCDGDEETDFFKPISGDFYNQQPAKNVQYQITDDEKGLWLWSDEDFKLFFLLEVLSVEKNELEKSVVIYPNPTENYIRIQLKNNIQISEILILDFQGKEIMKSKIDSREIDISSLAAGPYFVKLKIRDELFVVKKIVKK